MKETLKEALLRMKKEQSDGYVSFFNTGITRTDKKEYSSNYIKPSNDTELRKIKNVLGEATRCYTDRYEFDSISMNLDLGIVYRKEDLNDDNTIKENASPLKDVVRFYTGSINSYLNDEKTNIADYNEFGFGRQGVINYSYLVNALKEDGVSFDGPDSFNELKSRIMSGELFDIKMSVDLKENIKLTRKK